MQRLRVALALSAIAFVAAAVAPASSSANITFGSDLKSQPENVTDDCLLTDGSCTHVLTGVHSGNEFPARSPTDGVIVKFRIESATADVVTFRLARVSDDFRAKGAGTGSVVLLPSPGTFSFPADTPVRAGDYVGVDSSSVTAGACPTRGRWFAYFPPLEDGGQFQSPAYNSTCEFLINATVRPSNRFNFDGVSTNDSRGTAKLALDLPGPGGLKLSGKGIKRVKKHASRAGNVKLAIRAKGKAKRRLINRGKLKVHVKVGFKPEGGKPRSKSKTVKLVRH